MTTEPGTGSMNSSASQEPRPAAHFARVERRPPESCGPSTRQDRRASIVPLPPVNDAQTGSPRLHETPAQRRRRYVADTFQAGRPSSSPPSDLGRGRRVKAKPPAVASRAWTQRPRPRGAATRRTGQEQGTKHPRTSTGPPMIAVPLARVTRGQPGPLGSARSASLAAVIAALPKLMVRVRFS